jgi:hypothetical protein
MDLRARSTDNACCNALTLSNLAAHDSIARETAVAASIRAGSCSPRHVGCSALRTVAQNLICASSSPELRTSLQVNKPVALVQEFERLCNDSAAAIFDVADRKVHCDVLDGLEVRTVGLFGPNEVLLDALQAQGAHAQLLMPCMCK